MKKLCAFVFFILTSSSVYAQSITIAYSNNFASSPVLQFQKTIYNSEADWPTISAQSHWGVCNNMPFTSSDLQSLLNPSLCHIHTTCKAPYWGRIIQPITIKCTTTLFHLDGTVYGVNEGNSGIKWESTGTSSTAPISGDPMGIVERNFTYTINPTSWDTTNGFVCVGLSTRAFLRNGSVLTATFHMPFYSATNTSVAEHSNCGARLRAQTEANSWGSVIVETADILPLMGPLGIPFTYLSFNGYTYGAGVLGSRDARADLDLHNGITGHPITFGRFDKNELGSGTHKVAMIWKDNSGSNGTAQFPANQAIASLLVMNVISDTATPIDVCPNIDGVQETVPSGMQLINGQCVAVTPPSNSVLCSQVMSGQLPIQSTVAGNLFTFSFTNGCIVNGQPQ